VLNAMRDWRDRFGRLPSSYDGSRTHARQRGVEAMQRLAAGDWPSSSVVTSLFGSCAIARAAAEGPDGAVAQEPTHSLLRPAYKGAMAEDEQQQGRSAEGGKRRYGTGSIFEKRNSWYGQWRVRNRMITRKLGPVRSPGSRDGLTRKMAEARLRKLIAEVTVAPVYERMTVREVGERLVKHLVTRGRKPSTTAGYESYLRVHIGPFFGEKPIADVTKEDVEEFVAVCLDDGQSIKNTRNLLGFLHSVFDFGLRKGWVVTNPCKAVEKPETAGEDHDIRFLDQTELDALLAATAGPHSRRKPGTTQRARRVRLLRDGDGLPWKRIAAELGIAESTAIYLYNLDPDEIGPVAHSARSTASFTSPRR
jgi:hypothetical protein